MSEQPRPPAPTTHTDIRLSESDVEANEQRPETNDPDAFTDDGTLGGLGGSEREEGGAG